MKQSHLRWKKKNELFKFESIYSQFETPETEKRFEFSREDIDRGGVWSGFKKNNQNVVPITIIYKVVPWFWELLSNYFYLCELGERMSAAVYKCYAL